jgi:hypothetical protein
LNPPNTREKKRMNIGRNTKRIEVRTSIFFDDQQGDERLGNSECGPRPILT